MNTSTNDPVSHDFEVVSEDTGRVVARIWHSDKGEWTIDATSGATFKRRTVADALALVAAQYGEITVR